MSLGFGAGKQASLDGFGRLNRQMHIAAVVIGRNEGERLIRCLNSAIQSVSRLVYVDSGSTDGSSRAALALGVEVVQRDPELPFTAARARNAGFKALQASFPQMDIVQFIDGDCELVTGWVERGGSFLDDQSSVAVAFGHLRERFPNASIYNKLCAMEWDGPLGDVDSCGGIAMVRAATFAAVGGFREDLIAGEEPELCFRIRREGWKVYKLGAEMALHDAAMTSALQWWSRNRRSGYSIAEAAADRGKDIPRLRRQVASNFIWSIPPIWILWPLLWWRIMRTKGALYAAHIVFGKIPHAQGQLQFWKNRLLKKRSKIIEYK
jgi:GT2 family glycosyltransferase